MALKTINDEHLVAIGNAIREKNGTTTQYKPSEMGAAISALSGGDFDEEDLKLTGDIDYMFYQGNWDWFLNKYGHQITTEDIDSAQYCFEGSTVEAIPFEINCFTPTYNLGTTVARMFYNCKNLKEAPVINNLTPSGMSYMFNGCSKLKSINNINISDGSKLTYGIANMFDGCNSLRNINPNLLAPLSNDTSGNGVGSMFFGCYSLDEVINMPAPNAKLGPYNKFTNTFVYCWRLKDVIFKTNENGTPLVRNWSGQSIILTSAGWIVNTRPITDITGYNSGITADKAVSDAATYEVLKNDPDWFATTSEYSRYNHDSAVNTINSLPDCSAYLASSGEAVNTIKFISYAGEATDGGAISNLTEEEIAVAVAKGWTVTY